MNVIINYVYKLIQHQEIIINCSKYKILYLVLHILGIN